MLYYDWTNNILHSQIHAKLLIKLASAEREVGISSSEATTNAFIHGWNKDSQITLPLPQSSNQKMKRDWGRIEDASNNAPKLLTGKQLTLNLLAATRVIRHKEKGNGIFK